MIPLAPARPGKLTPAQAETLRALAAEHPRATRRQLAELFRAATGRGVGEGTILRACGPRRPADPPPPAPDGFAYLEPPERDALLRLMRDHPGASDLEVVQMMADEIHPRVGP